jgi:hypothetical protein
VVIQLNDNCKSRLINHPEADNIYVKNRKRLIQSQVEISKFFSGKSRTLRTITEYNIHSNGKYKPKPDHALEK